MVVRWPSGYIFTTSFLKSGLLLDIFFSKSSAGAATVIFSSLNIRDLGATNLGHAEPYMQADRFVQINSPDTHLAISFVIARADVAMPFVSTILEAHHPFFSEEVQHVDLKRVSLLALSQTLSLLSCSSNLSITIQSRYTYYDLHTKMLATTSSVPLQCYLRRG